MDFFAYGTLMCADIIHRVVGWRPGRAPAACYEGMEVRNRFSIMDPDTKPVPTR